MRTLFSAFFSIYCITDNCYDVGFSLLPLKYVSYIIISKILEYLLPKNRRVLLVLISNQIK